MALSSDNLEKLQSWKENYEKIQQENGFVSVDQLLDGEVILPPIDSEDGMDAEPQMTRDGKTLSTSVVSIVAYLVGVNEEQFGKNYKLSVFQTLQQQSCARIIRSLCSIRNGIMRQPGKIYNALKLSICNLDSLPNYIDPQLFRYLEEQHIRIITGTQIKELTEYLTIINNYLANQADSCMHLFPSWVNPTYIRDILLMPNGTKKNKIQEAMDTFKANHNSYPYQCYINWPIDHKYAFVEDPKSYAEPVLTGNVLLNDRKFLVLLYRTHDDEFRDYARVYEASISNKQALEGFLRVNPQITVLVDCENSDPYKLCALFEYMMDARRQQYELSGPETEQPLLGHIQKIILFDDAHTVDAWDILGDYVHVPIVHEEVERVLGHKSLVDIAMAVGACKEHMLHHMDVFMVASSDSDYWGLMRALPDCKFLVLAEENKFSNETKEFYQSRGIPFCLIDDFATNLSKIKEGALRHGLEKRLNNLMAINLDDILLNLYDELRLDMTNHERENYRAKLDRKLQAFVDSAGTVGLRIHD